MHQTQQQIIEAASHQFLAGASRKEVLNFLDKNNIPKEELETYATQAYQLIKKERKSKLNLFERRLTVKEMAIGAGLFIIIFLLEECGDVI